MATDIDELTNVALTYARHYKDNGHQFIRSFIKYGSYRGLCLMAVEQFEKNVKPYEPDETICNFIAKLEMDPKLKRPLCRTLKMIKLITQ